MKTHALQLLFALLLLSFPCLGQLSNGGEVVEVVDGRTIVVETRNGRVKVELQFIEVPEAGHQLHDTVKGHLSRLLLGRVVEFKPRVIFPDRVIGRVLLNDVDVSQQMLRDGAARHIPREVSGQDKNEFVVYGSTEASAKTEKRGVWSITGPFPTRAENVDANPPRPVLASVSRRGSAPAVGMADVAPLLEAWVAASPVDENESAGLKTHNDPTRGYTSISTPVTVLEFASDNTKQKLECRAIYAAASSSNGPREPMYLLGLRAISKESDFPKRDSSITVVAERYVVPLAPVPEVAEFRHYRISKAFLTRIANTRSVEFQIDGFKGALSDEAKEFFKQLLAATE